MNTLLLKSSAKVNVGLQIINKRKDHLHNINTLFQEIDLHDTIELKRTNSGCKFNSNVSWLKNDDSNLCVKAWSLLSKKFKLDGISIKLKKKIPPGSGLGGGSSNAATMIKGVCSLYEIEIDKSELNQIAMELGSDVPFFLNGGLQQAVGIGEQLTPFNGCINGVYLLIMPNIHIDTKWAYECYDKKFLHLPKDKVKFASLLGNGSMPFEFFENDFESIVVPAYPEIGRIKKILQGEKPKYTSLSGSGSTVYGIFDDEAKANSAESIISHLYSTYIARPISCKL